LPCAASIIILSDGSDRRAAEVQGRRPATRVRWRIFGSAAGDAEAMIRT
jgi:hypothetical protein